jgi:hypothetical protein
MESAPQPERLNPEGFAAFNDRTGDGSPVVMLNLLSFKPEGGREHPTRNAFLEMVGSPEYQAIAHLRTEALAAGELHPLEGGEL